MQPAGSLGIRLLPLRGQKLKRSTANGFTQKMPSPYYTGLWCRCPRCGKGKLGFLTVKTECDSCGLNFNFANVGDGATIVVIMIAGAIVVAAALFTEVKYQPPYGLTRPFGFP